MSRAPRARAWFRRVCFHALVSLPLGAGETAGFDPHHEPSWSALAAAAYEVCLGDQGVSGAREALSCARWQTLSGAYDASLADDLEDSSSVDWVSLNNVAAAHFVCGSLPTSTRSIRACRS